ncbi:MAG: YrdB family protein [Actinomycetota bacterium]|nr:YrdB family protein [Actinomycetota bacterium]
MLTLAKPVNLAARFLLELCALGALGYWGFAVGWNPVAKLALGLGAPLLAAAVWGLFVAPKAVVPLNMPLRLVPEALVFGSAVAALFATGHPLLAACLAVLVAVNRALVLAWK